jgi:hypothetical protein
MTASVGRGKLFGLLCIQCLRFSFLVRCLDFRGSPLPSAQVACQDTCKPISSIHNPRMETRPLCDVSSGLMFAGKD